MRIFSESYLGPPMSFERELNVVIGHICNIEFKYIIDLKRTPARVALVWWQFAL